VRFLAVLALAGVAWLGAGCVMINVVGGNEVPEDRISLIRPGETTRAEILDWFGSPAAYTDPSGLRLLFEAAEVSPEDVLVFPYADVLVFQLTRAKGRALLLFVLNYVEARGASDRLVVFFDDRDRVMYYGYRKGTDALD
jgi:hypothetical protein